MSEVGRPSVSGLPALPADVWAAIARATLRAEGDHAHAWEQLRRVNSIWRAALEGVALMVIFGHNATQEQMSLLLTTTLPLRSLTFAPCDRASCIMLRQPAILQTSHETLEELHHVCAPKAADSLRLPPVRSLTRFGALRSLTLHENSPRCAEWPSRLPVSLQTLTMAVAQGGWFGKLPEWSLAHLTRLTELSLEGPDTNAVMLELLQSRATPALPASLLKLRQKSWDVAWASAPLRSEPLAAVTIPVLELEGGTIALTSLASGTHGHDAGDLPEAAGLPSGFSALWLRTDCIKPPSAGHPDGAAVAFAVQPAERLCRFLGLAPRCYQEFRLFTYWDLSVGTERKVWLPNSNYSASHP